MATPQSAFLRAGESLVPSPVTATMPFHGSRCRLRTMSCFCSGSVRAKTRSGCSRMLSNHGTRLWCTRGLRFSESSGWSEVPSTLTRSVILEPGTALEHQPKYAAK